MAATSCNFQDVQRSDRFWRSKNLLFFKAPLSSAWVGQH